jgi:hypothetical protein
MTQNNKGLLADFSQGNFVDVPGPPHLVQSSVMPICALENGVPTRIVGTCFAVTNDGLALTARHVVDEALGRQRGDSTFDQGKYLAAIYCSPDDQGADNGGNLLGGLLPIRMCELNDDLDICLIHLHLPRNTVTGSLLRVPVTRLATGLPAVGSTCIALGYRASALSIQGENANVIHLDQRFSVTRGLIKEVHYPRRDSSNLHFPCVQIEARFDGGMSGGPVLNENFEVVGAVCSSFGATEGDTPISFFSLIGPALGLSIVALDSAGEHRRVFLYDLVRGHTNTGGTSVRVHRNEIEFDFGQAQRIRSLFPPE